MNPDHAQRFLIWINDSVVFNMAEMTVLILPTKQRTGSIAFTGGQSFKLLRGEEKAILEWLQREGCMHRRPTSEAA